MTDRQRPGRPARAATLALMALAALTLELALSGPMRPSAAALGLSAAELALAAAGGLWLRRRQAVAVALLALPLAVAPLRYFVLGEGRPTEVLLLSGFRDLGVGLTVAAARPGLLRLAGLVSLFLVLFATAVGEHPAVVALAAGYGAAGGLWLMCLYWQGLAAPPGGVRPRIPWFTAALILGLVLAAGAVAGTGPRRAAAVLAELVPTSGGTGEFDPDARGGVNDGDEEARGDNAQSTGFVESDQFLNSHDPALYDLQSDMYGEPQKQREQERAVALDGMRARELDRRPAENLRAGREFSAARRAPRPGRPLADRAAQALLYLQGPTPLHVRLTAYDRFDGVRWAEAPAEVRAPNLTADDNPRWLRLRAPEGPPVFAGTASHVLKLGLLRTAAVPGPAHLTRFRLGKVTRPDFFRPGPPGILRVDRCSLPAGTVVETEARTVDPERLRACPLPADLHAPPEYLALATDLPDHAAVAALARHWAGDVPRGWGQVEAVGARLREHAEVDPAAAVPEGCRDAVGHFLLRSRRGPDYLFASAAAVLLRTLGYPTRVVSGLYARPERYDPATGHTAVLAEDVHFWAEVLLPGGTWVTVEPTPGYDLAPPAWTWCDRLRAAGAAAARWAHDHAAALAAAAGLLVLAAARHRQLAGALATARWALAGRRCWRRRVRATLRLVETRARLAGRPRPRGRTPARWYAADAELARLLALADAALYSGPGASAPCRDAEVAEICRRAARAWPLRRFRRPGAALLSTGATA